MGKKKKAAEFEAAAESVGLQDELVSKYVRDLRAREQAREVITAERAAALYTQPPGMESLEQLLKKDRPPLKYTIEDLHPLGSNTLIAAQYKVGKTMLMANLAKAYADGDRFLGEFPMNPGGGRLAVFNYELNEDMLIDQYLKPMGIVNSDRIVVWNLRGRNFDLRSRDAFNDAVRWLKKMGCDAIIMDPFGAAARLQNENDNSEARNWLLGCLDPLKYEAGIQDLWMPAHTGRGEAEEGGEHVRGASSVDDWADVRWLYTKAMVSGADGTAQMQRFLSARNSRGVDVGERQIDFDKDDNMLYVLKAHSRAQARSAGASHQALRTVADSPGINSTALRAAMDGDTKVRNAGIKAAVSNGWIRVEAGPNRSSLHSITEAGSKVLGAR
ncbi:AAA family ATPase [Kribbella sp. DT2]|uniref:AAA family ATPase n=1 Tax=Kribbella sp. DT2 TaxID=3393427 RepID=UPI003CE828A5